MLRYSVFNPSRKGLGIIHLTSLTVLHAAINGFHTDPKPCTAMFLMIGLLLFKKCRLMYCCLVILVPITKVWCVLGLWMEEMASSRGGQLGV